MTSLLDSYKKSLATMELYDIASGGRAYGIKCGEIINVKKGQLCILQRGHATAHLKKINGINNPTHYHFSVDMLEGMTLGLFEIYTPSVTFEYVAQCDVDILVLSEIEIENQVSRGGSNAIQLFKLLSYMFAFITCVAFENNRDTAFSIVRGMIYRYAERKTLDSLGDELLVNFILRRTNLSRSYVFKIISRLKKDGYIALSSGRLTEIKVRLPVEY